MTDAVESEQQMVSASLFEDVAERFRGHLDVADPRLGIEGWALNLDAPRQPVVVELRLGNMAIGTCETGRQRDEIAAMVGEGVRPGFRFPDELTDALIEQAPARPGSDIRVRIAGTEFTLPSLRGVMTGGDFVGKDALPAGSRKGADFNLRVRLSTLRVSAAEIARRPLRPLPDHNVGFVEAVAIDEGGFVWLAGWMRRSHVVDSAVVVVDRQKSAAGLAYSVFERSDLPEEACGIVGVLYTDWRPTSGSEAFLYFGEAGRSYLRTVASLRVTPMADFNTFLLETLKKCHTGHGAALESLMMRPDSWAVTASDPGFPVRAALEHALVLPGFGALASGWALSPLKEIETFGLRIGASALACDPQSLYFYIRNDLAGVFPGNDRLLPKAGFVMAFRGALPSINLSNPVLKLIYTDGTSTNHAVEPQVMRWLGKGVDAEAAAEIMPSITTETFFNDFAHALRRSSRDGTKPPRPHSVARARNSVILAVPENHSDMFLLLSELKWHVGGNAQSPSIVLLASATQLRPNLLSFLDRLQAAGGPACSVFFIDDIAYALYDLPAVLAATGAERFAFVAAGICLRPAGWLAVMQALALSRTELTVFEIADPAGPEQPGALTAECFAWSAAPFRNWISGAPVFLGGFYQDNGLLAGHRAEIMPGAAYRTALPQISAFTEAVNRLAAA